MRSVRLVNLTLRHALACAKLGWHVFPCLPGDKRPNGFLVKRGVKDASKDPVKLTRWFDRFPEQNIGLACGPSGLVVIDVDTRAGGLLEFEDLLRQGAFPRTPKALTGGGGFHFFFRATSIPLKNGPLRGHRGIDVKTDGGYVVIAPSLHASGRRYEWDPNARPSATPVADLPDWLFQIARVMDTPTPVPIRPSRPPGPSPLDRASRYLARCEPSVQGQGGSVACLKSAIALVQGFDLSDDDAYYLLATEFNPRCTPPWSERELRRKVKEAGRLAPAKGHARGWLADKPLAKRVG
jgi:hypothetical protein